MGEEFYIASFADDGYREIRDLTFPNKRQYARKHGYRCVLLDWLPSSRPAAWSKIIMLYNLMEFMGPGWIFWTDADSVFMNMEIRLEKMVDPTADLVASADQNGINTGNFFIRSSEKCQRFLKAVWACEEFINHEYWEQAAMWHLMTRNYPIRAIPTPKRLFNSYPHEYQPGDFILHAAGIKKRPQLIREYLERGGLWPPG
jgi:hypothetical protein